MAEVKTATTPHEVKNKNNLDAAYEAAKSFVASKAQTLVIPDEMMRNRAREECSFKLVTVDEAGFTGSMLANILGPARDFLAGWQELKAHFTTALSPYEDKLKAIDSLFDDIAKLEKEKDDKIAHIEERARKNRRFVDAETALRVAEQGFERISQAEGERAANMWFYNPLYWVFLLMIGVAEWLINYDTFLGFLHVPAMAAGTTAILGVALAFAAHGHGTIFRQWSYRFSPGRSRTERFSEFRFLGLSTLALTIVVGAAGGSRYAWAMSSIAAMPSGSIIPGIDMPQVNPLRDVLLSLLGNIAAWLVGVFLAFLLHDKDPELMSWTHQRKTASKRFLKLDREYSDEKQTVTAAMEKKISDQKTRADVQSRAVQAERDKRDMVEKHEEAVLGQIVSVVQRNIRSYQNILGQAIMAEQGKVEIAREGKAITPFEFNAIKIEVTAETVSA